MTPRLLPLAVVCAALTVSPASPQARQQVPDSPVLRVAMGEMQRLQAERSVVTP